MYLSETCESLSWGFFCWMSWKFYVDIIGNLTIGRPRFGSWFISNNLYLKCNSDAAVRRIMDPILLPGEMIVHFLHAHTHTYIHSRTHTYIHTHTHIHTLTHTSMRACTHTGLRQWTTPPLNDSGARFHMNSTLLRIHLLPLLSFFQHRLSISMWSQRRAGSALLLKTLQVRCCHKATTKKLTRCTNCLSKQD